MPYRLGVDIGTTFTAAAVLPAADARTPTTTGSGMIGSSMIGPSMLGPSMIGLGNRALQIPSAVYLPVEGAPIVGEAAERQGRVEPDRLAREFKRRIGDHVPMLVGGCAVSAEMLTGWLLRDVIDRATSLLREPPREVVATHPVNWHAYRLERFRDVLNIAGVSDARLCPEPLAAASQYAAQSRVAIGERVLVFDLGGGTFDVCVLEKTADGFTLMGRPDGVERLGGVDFDEALFQHVLRGSGRDGPVAARIREVLADSGALDSATERALLQLRRDCAEAKEALSTDVTAIVPLALPGLPTTAVRVTRAEFEGLIATPLEAALDACRRALRSARLEPAELSTVLLVGGSSRIPLVTELVIKAFERPVAVDIHPKHDVALGAARYGGAVPTTDPLEAAEPPARIAAPRQIDVRSQSGRPLETAPPARSDPPAVALLPSAHPRLRRLRPARRSRRAAVAVAAGVLLTIGAALAAWPWSRADENSAAGAAPVRSLPEAAALPSDRRVVSERVAGNRDLYLIDPSSRSTRERLTTDPADETDPVIAPGRRTIAYLHGSDRPVPWVMGADGTGARPLFDGMPPECAGGVDGPFDWSPSGAELALSCRDAENRSQIVLLGLDARPRPAVPRAGADVGDPAYSPDGRRLVFWASDPADRRGGSLYVADLTSPEPRMTSLTRGLPGQDSQPSWSPDGRIITFTRRVLNGQPWGRATTMTVPADGSRPPSAR
ncbi:MAG TPA: Hsp70 family protein [Microlunatus sp.]|nr:Hsp70 family protein [Microlunatus sp.]